MKQNGSKINLFTVFKILGLSIESDHRRLPHAYSGNIVPLSFYGCLLR